MTIIAVSTARSPTCQMTVSVEITMVKKPMDAIRSPSHAEGTVRMIRPRAMLFGQEIEDRLARQRKKKQVSQHGISEKRTRSTRLTRPPQSAPSCVLDFASSAPLILSR